MELNSSASGTYAFWAGAESAASAKFWVKRNGDVSMSGNLNLSNASSIIWGANSSPMHALYARTSIAKPTNEYSTYPDSSRTGWHKVLSSSYDFYASYTYDGGTTWTDVIKLQGADGKDGQNGEDGKDGHDGSDANVTWENVLNAFKHPSTTETFISATSAGAPIIYGGEIYSPHIYGNSVNLYPLDDGQQGSFNLCGTYNGTLYTVLKIDYEATLPPTTHIGSPARAVISFSDEQVSFYGSYVDFTHATVSGLSVTAVFG